MRIVAIVSFLVVVYAGVTPTAEAARPAACAPAPTFPGVTAGHSAPGTVAPATGVLRGLLLSVDFPNAAGDYPPREHLAPAERADVWFRTVSGGRLTLAVTGLERWLRLPLSSDVYAEDQARYYADAVAAADPYVDFRQVDVIYLVPTQGATGLQASFAVLNSFGVAADGKELRFWISFSNGSGRNDPSHWLLVHETGHLLGLPDLYTPLAPQTFHRWDVMAARYPAELLAWHRWKLGWLDAAQVVCVTGRTERRLTLTPLARPGGVKALLVRRGSEVVVAEVRARLGYDSGLCRPGVLVYRVNTTPLRRSPVQLFSARPTPRTRVGACGSAWNIAFSARSTFRLPAWRLRLRVLGRLPDGSYRLALSTRVAQRS